MRRGPHPPTAFIPTDRTTRGGRQVWECPACGKELPATPGRPCEGTPAESQHRPPPQAVECIHRRPTILDRVPCGTCAATGRAKTVPVYLCVFGGGRACSVVEVGRADVTACGRCGDRV